MFRPPLAPADGTDTFDPGAPALLPHPTSIITNRPVTIPADFRMAGESIVIRAFLRNPWIFDLNQLDWQHVGPGEYCEGIPPKIWIAVGEVGDPRQQAKLELLR